MWSLLCPKDVRGGQFLVRRCVDLVLMKLGENSMCKLEMMIESERKRRMQLDEKVNVLIVELEEKNNLEKRQK